jgi:hypothetical protein
MLNWVIVTPQENASEILSEFLLTDNNYFYFKKRFAYFFLLLPVSTKIVLYSFNQIY